MFVCKCICMIVKLVFFIHPDNTVSTNNRITLCSYYVQLYARLCEQLRLLIMLRVFQCPMSQSAFYLLHDMHLRNYFRVRICSIFFQMLDPSFRSYYALYGCTTTITACVATTKLLACLLKWRPLLSLDVPSPLLPW